ncbi:hypothetical protein METP2_01712 [Methanosarcinales archaeon]|nr:cytochrome c3 family protein [Candidatus Methanoperedens sp. BLZ2]KAB2948501.1 MAG: hypothetical protein F9K14_01345 [Candidatus Methanoperedens sp.]MBZ0174394.1 hypothetical protein [Candidatus Methanoperedens nitroreducens]MCX9078414.1 hypothetical protein [Candidatus Methanoperedens sp.]CAG0976696.1 hypothetical protein METP2_01712 [Methanosarcinales archaeon]
MKESIKHLFFIVLAVQMINVSSAAANQDAIIVIEDARHISNETDVVGQNETVGNYTGSELVPGQYIKIGEVPGTFHESALTNGSFNPECSGCHRLGGIAAKQVDVDALKKSVHANLNNITESTGVIDPVNRACWACHGNGTMPATHPEEYMAPRSCASCHFFATDYNAPGVSGHTKAGENLTLNISCERCHGNSLVNSGLNSTKSNVSHYLAKIAYNSTDCLSCHGNPANATKWGNASLVYSHVKNGSCTDCHGTGQVKTLHDINLTIPAERTCVKCHTKEDAVEKYGAGGIIRTHYPGAPQGRANTTAQNSSFSCELCHNASNTTLHNRTLTRNLLYQDNISQENNNNILQIFCSDCHSAAGNFPYKPAVQIPRLIHGNQTEHTALGMKLNCETCHDSNRLSRFHKPTLAWERPVGMVVDSRDARCTDCHNTHIKQTVQKVTCTTCHSGYDASHYSSLIVENINKTLTCGVCHNEIKNEFHNLTVPDKEFVKPRIKTKDTVILSCDSCHNATGKEKFHYSEFPTGTIQSPGWNNWSNGTRVNKCQDCHVKNGGEQPFKATNLTYPLHRDASDCTLCHGGDTPISLHVLQKSTGVPYIKDIILVPQKSYAGENISISVLAVAGWDASIANVEYFIDIVGEGGSGRNLTSGKELAGGQVREAFADMDTTDLKEGTHIVSVHAQDSKGRWGDVLPAPFVINKEIRAWYLFRHWELVFLVAGVLVLIYLFKKFGK